MKIRSIANTLRLRSNQMTHCGCTVRQLRAHLESLFKPGMCWENYGQWEVDHIVPVVFYGGAYSDAYRAVERDHFSNLQPLWRQENKKKRNRVNGVDIWEARRARWTVGGFRK